MMTGMTTPAAVITDVAVYAQAVEDAVKASAAYYTVGTSVLDDDAYDRLVRGIAAWEADHPDQVLPESTTGKVAGGAVEGDVPHTVAMLSLDNVFSPEEFTASAGAARCTPPQHQSVELASRGTIYRTVTHLERETRRSITTGVLGKGGSYSHDDHP
jgi:hypothetical protein